MLTTMMCALRPWAVVALIVAFIGDANAIYARNSPVLQVDTKNYDSLIAQSNYTSIVEFYAPWCGHCQNLKEAYEKTAQNLAGLAKVAAVNCDEESNKVLCSRMGVQGFPTLKIVKPGSKFGRPIVEDYHGLRSAKALVNAVVDKIPNHVKKLQDQDFKEWLSVANGSSKAILFSKKGTTSALLRAVAIDFLSSISIAQIRSKEKDAVKTFGVSRFPSLVLLPGGDREQQIYEGEMKKETLIAFLSQAASPNPDPAPKSSKTTSSKSLRDAKAPRASSSSFSEASASYRVSEATEAAVSRGSISSENSETSKPSAETSPMLPDAIIAIENLATPKDLESACLRSQTGTCILVLLPVKESPEIAYPSLVNQATTSLAEIADKHARRKSNIFPFYTVPAGNGAAKSLRNGLGLKRETELEIIAVNGKRNWWIRFKSDDTGLPALESFLDDIKLGEGKKEPIPHNIILAAAAAENRHVEL